MTSPAFLADEDLRHAVVRAVIGIEAAVDFATVQELGLQGTPDDALLSLAAEAGRIIVSHDFNTMSAAAHQRVAAGLPMAGLLLASQSASTSRVANTLLVIVRESTAEEWKNIVDFIPW